jgi:hypothetical protein
MAREARLVRSSQLRIRMGWRSVTLGLALAAACASSTPPPEPQRSPSPTMPSCLTDADCKAGEECRKGECVRHGVDHPPVQDCPQGCPGNQICVDGVCVEATNVDAGDGGILLFACEQCPEGEDCDYTTGSCRPRALPPDAGPRPDER